MFQGGGWIVSPAVLWWYGSLCWVVAAQLKSWLWNEVFQKNESLGEGLAIYLRMCLKKQTNSLCKLQLCACCLEVLSLKLANQCTLLTTSIDKTVFYLEQFSNSLRWLLLTMMLYLFLTEELKKKYKVKWKLSVEGRTRKYLLPAGKNQIFWHFSFFIKMLVPTFCYWQEPILLFIY